MKALVTVEVQLCSDLFFSLGCLNGIQHKIDVLFRACFVCNNAVVIEITNNGEIEEALSGSDVRNICYPFLIGTLSRKVSI